MYPPILLVCITAEQQALEVKAPRSHQSTDKPSVKSTGHKCSKNESWSVPDICKFLNVYLTNILTTGPHCYRSQNQKRLAFQGVLPLGHAVMQVVEALYYKPIADGVIGIFH